MSMENNMNNQDNGVSPLNRVGKAVKQQQRGASGIIAGIVSFFKNGKCLMAIEAVEFGR